MNESQPSSPDPEGCFSRIATDQNLLGAAKGGPGAARGNLALRYQRVIRAYLGALLRNDQDAEEVTADVLVDLLQGDALAAFDPAKERFRDYLKHYVCNAAYAYRHPRHALRIVPGDPEKQADKAESMPGAEKWDPLVRASTVSKAMKALRRFQRLHRQEHNVYYTVLRLYRAHPREDSKKLADRLAQKVGRPFTDANARKQLERARAKFAKLLVEEVRSTLEDPTPARLREELLDLRLYFKAVHQVLTPKTDPPGEQAPAN